jgi:hypothetical protein
MCWTDDAKANGSDPSATISMKRNKTALGGARRAPDNDRPAISQAKKPRKMDNGNKIYGLLFSVRKKRVITLFYYCVPMVFISWKAKFGWSVLLLFGRIC